MSRLVDDVRGGRVGMTAENLQANLTAIRAWEHTYQDFDTYAELTGVIVTELTERRTR